MLSKFDINKLNELSIEQVAGALGLSVNRHRALCPFHNDSNPSLTFNVRKNRYKCYVCDAHGGVIDLVMNYLHKDFLSACKWLADDFNIWLSDSLNSQPSSLNQDSLNSQPSRPFDASRYVRFFERPFLSEDARRFLFAERKLDPRVVKWCRLTSWKDRQGTSWLQIPYYDRDGKLIGVQNRNLSWTKVPQPSSLNRREPKSIGTIIRQFLAGFNRESLNPQL